MNQFMTTSTATSMMLTQTKQPVAMGLIMFIQTALMCLISSTMFKSLRLSYILFMIMVGGTQILFMYMAGIASNEMSSLPNEFMMMMIIIIMINVTPLISMMMTDPTSNKEMNNHNMMTENEVTMSATPMNAYMKGTLTIILVLYLFLTLIVVVKMSNINSEPLQQTKE